MFATTFLYVRRTAAIGFFVFGTIAGCGTSTQQALNSHLQASGVSSEAAFPFAGKVTIDGSPPKFGKAEGDSLLIVLFDRAKPNEKLAFRPWIRTDKNGNFAFHTYLKDDGARPGHYVATFAILHHRTQGFLGPDGLGNLYNDPDKNANDTAFNIEHQKPGKTDYLIDLKFAGVEPVTTPGSKSVREFLIH